MKVLLLGNGGSIHTARWASGLSLAGIELVLVTQHRDVLPLPETITVYQLPFSGNLGYFLNASALNRIWDLERPDILNVHYASGYGTTARISDCKPTLLSVWGSDVYQFPSRSPVHSWWMRGNLAAATKLASTSRAMAEEVRRLTRDIGEVAITPFGIDLDQFAPSKSLAARDDTIVIGTVKSLNSLYGIDILIEGFARLRAQLSEDAPELAAKLRLKIVGDGPQESALKVLAEKWDIANITHFLPRVPHGQVPEELAKLDIYAALSRHESFGVAVLEASACELPVIVSDVGGLPEVVIHGITGFVVPSECPRAAADALKKLVLDPNLRCTLGSAGRKHVRRHYKWQDSVNNMIETYRRLAP